MIMEGPCLLLVIACLFAASDSSYGASSLYSGCQQYNVHFLNCRSTGFTTLGDLFFLDQETRNVTSSSYLQRFLRDTKHIDLSYNMMSALYVNVFYKFVSLETLIITNNQIYRASMNKNGKQYEKGAFLTSLKTLVLNGNRLIAIPKGLCKLKSLQTLSLSANRILYIQQDDFASCTVLKHVDLGENRISNIHPDAFRDLRNLQVLKLHSNTLVSLSPLVFLFKHVLKADIDLSDNLWACDCSLQPLKYLISSLSMDVRKPWNVTCSTPFSKTGQHILSIENSKSCQTSDYSYVYDKTLLITAGEEASLDCEYSTHLKNKDVLWWTPYGIISKERQNGNHYLSNTNSLILHQPDNFDEGLYLCLTNAARIAYQVGIEVNNPKRIRRSPRDLQLKNVQMQTQSNFDLAVSLSVILTFLIAFFLGLFIRPYLESLWRKRCMSKNAEQQQSNAVYDNEGFTADYTTRKHGVNSNVNSLPQHKTGQTFDQPDNYKVEVENTTRIQERAIDVQNPTFNAVYEMHVDVNELPNKLPKTKRVKWASDEDLTTNVNLKYFMSLIKPIHFIVLDSSLPVMVYDHQSNTTNSDSFSGHKNYQATTMMPDDNCSSDEGSSFSLGSEYDVSDDDSITNIVWQETKQGRQNCNDHVYQTINLQHVTSLLKPIQIIVPDSTVPPIVESPKQKYLYSLSISTYPENRMDKESSQNDLQDNKGNEGPYENHSSGKDSKHNKNKNAANTLYDTSSSDESSHSSDSELSDKDKMLHFNILGIKKSKNTSNQNDSPTVNLKHVMSLLKPINIIVPESTTTKIVKSPKQKQLFPLFEYPENRMENLENFPPNREQDKRIPNDTNEPQSSKMHYTDAVNDSSSSDEESNISVNSEHYFSTEDTLIAFNLLKNQAGLANENPTVNLKHVITSLKPINITIPESTMPNGINNSLQQPLFPISLSKYPENRLEYADISSNNYDKDNTLPEEQSHLQSTDPGEHLLDSKKAIEVTRPVCYSSSSENSSEDTDDSDKAIISSISSKPLQRQWLSDENVYPTVNLRHVISTFKPIEIKVPDVIHHSDISPKIESAVASQRQNYYSSSDEHSSNSVDSDQNSLNAFVTNSSTIPVPKPRKRAGSEKVYPSVNLKHIISSLKPLHISIPDSTHYSDTLVSPKEITQNLFDFSSSESSNDFDSEYEGSDEEAIMSPNVSETMPTKWKNHQDLTLVNLKYITSLLRPINIKVPDTTHDSNLLVNSDKNKEVMLYDRSSSDEEFSEFSDLDDLELDGQYKNVSLLTPSSTEWASSENIYPTVNLKEVMCSLKPIRVKAPDANYSDMEVTIPQLYDNSSSNECLDKSDNSEYDGSDEDVRSQSKLTETMSSNYETSTVNLKYVISLLKPVHVNVPDTHVCPKKNIEVAQEQSDSSSSYDSSNDSFDYSESSEEEVIRTSTLLTPTAIEWASSDLTLTVNLKQVISLLKPIHINIPDTIGNSDILVKKDTNVTQKMDSFNSSDATTTESSNESADSEHEGLDEEVIQSIYLPKPTMEWKNDDYSTPTVNLKHVISSLKPIHIKVPDTFYYSSDLYQPNANTDDKHKLYDSISSDESSNDSFDLKHPVSNEEMMRMSTLPELAESKWATNENLTPTVNLKHVISLLKPIQIKVPDTTHYPDILIGPKDNIEITMEKLPEYSSSDERSNDSVDSDHESSDDDLKRRTDIPKPVPTTWASTENLSSTVNIRLAISAFKPLNFVVSDPSKYSDIHMSPNTDTGVMQNLYDNILPKTIPTDSDSDSDSDGLEDVIISNLPKPVSTILASNEIVYPTVNLKNVLSLLRPIHIKLPDSPNYADSFIIPMKAVEVSKKVYENSSSDESSDESGPEGSYEVTNQKMNDNSSADEDSNDSKLKESHEGILLVKHSSLPSPSPTEWATTEDLSPTVNFKHILSLIKPIKIKVQDSPYDLHTLKIPQTNIEVTQEEYDESSHGDGSTDSEHEDPDKIVITNSTLPKLTPVDLTRNENAYPTVNLKNVIFELKPIKITVPENTIQIKVADSAPYLDILGSPQKINKVTAEKHFDNSSSDESSNDSAESEHEKSEENMSSNVSTPTLTEWANTKIAYPTVNLKKLTSLLKPISITAPDSAVPEVLERPIHIKPPDSQNYSDAFIIPMKAVEVSKNLYENSSSDDSSAESEREGLYEVTNQGIHSNSSIDEESNNSLFEGSHEGILLVKHSTLPTSTTTEWAITENLSPIVSFKHILSLIKPIKIKVQDSPYDLHTLKIPQTNIEVTQEKYDGSSHDDSSTDSEHEDSNNYVIKNSKLTPTEDTLITPEENIEVTSKTVNDINLSHDHSNYYADSEHEGPDEYVARRTEWARKVQIYPTVNLKHAISLLKPIQIKVPGSAYYLDTPGSPLKINEVTAERLFDSSSSDESSKDFADSEHDNSDEHIMSSNLSKLTLMETAGTEMAYPTVNLKNVTSLLKPIRIIAPDSAVSDAVIRPKWKPFFLSNKSGYKEKQADDFDEYPPISHSFSQPKSQLHNKNYKQNHSYTFKNPNKDANVTLTSYKKISPSNTLDSIDDWGHKDFDNSDATNYNLIKSNLAAQARNNDDVFVVNLKHVMSLIKPVSIIEPVVTVTKLVKHPPPVPPRKSRKSLQEQSSSSFHEKAMTSNFPVPHSTVSKDLSQGDLITFNLDSSEEVAL